jgi:hypothetical protein
MGPWLRFRPIWTDVGATRSRGDKRSTARVTPGVRIAQRFEASHVRHPGGSDPIRTPISDRAEASRLEYSDTTATRGRAVGEGRRPPSGFGSNGYSGTSRTRVPPSAWNMTVRRFGPGRNFTAADLLLHTGGRPVVSVTTSELKVTDQQRPAQAPVPPCRAVFQISSTNSQMLASSGAS